MTVLTDIDNLIERLRTSATTWWSPTSLIEEAADALDVYRKATDGLHDLLVRADSICSLVGYRGLDEEAQDELIAVSRLLRERAATFEMPT